VAARQRGSDVAAAYRLAALNSAFRLTARFVVRSALSFCLIVAVLLAGRAILTEWRAYDAARLELQVLQRGERQLGAERAQMRGDAIASVKRLRLAPAEVLDQRIAELGARILALSAVPDPATLTFPLPGGGQLAQALVAKSGRMVEIELLAQQRDYLVALRALANRAGATQDLALLRAAHVAAYEALNDNLRAQSRIRVNSLLRSYIPGSVEYRIRARLEGEREQLVRVNNDAARAWQAQDKAIRLGAAPQAGLDFIVNEARLDGAMGQLRNGISDGTAYAMGNWVGRMADAVREVAPAAGAILLALILLPVAIKVVFYYVLAPLAERRPPFYLDRSANGLLADAMGNRSAASRVVTLDEGDEMLIQSACIQSASVTVTSNTRWMLDWANPFTCLAAGLFALTRMVSAKPASIVVSPADDPLAEIAVITLPEGSAMVFQPRALVGVIHRREHPVRMARYWRLWSLHAWLTLQLRYLVFRGPVTLIVKGCRGVRVDAVDQGRVISQAATLGFSTSTAYSTSRCQTFLPYLTGRSPLLNDRFEAEVGFCVYEEALPADAQKGIFGRGLEGLADSVLKVFGV
jgi:hypothetical protein